jgi:hypothetical protein
VLEMRVSAVEIEVKRKDGKVRCDQDRGFDELFPEWNYCWRARESVRPSRHAFYAVEVVVSL